MRVRAVLVAFLLAAGLAWPSPADTGAAERFVYQSAKLSPLLDSMTYVITGKRTPKGCLFDYPELVLGPGELAREQRDIGIDIAGCTKLVEEGVPTSDDFPVADASLKESVGSSSETTGASTAASEQVSSGYHATWYENYLGQLLTGDQTNITWTWNGSCVTSGSTSGEWSYNSVYGWYLISKGGSQAITCSRYTGETRSTWGKNMSSCRHYFYYVRALGSYTGKISGSVSEQATCGPVWFKSSIVKTT